MTKVSQQALRSHLCAPALECGCAKVRQLIGSFTYALNNYFAVMSVYAHSLYLDLVALWFLQLLLISVS